MSRILFHGVLLPLSRLSFTSLYRLSDLLYLILYKVVGYRTKVVFGNLRNAFPEKDEAEIRRIAEKFYHHLSDLIVEALSSFSLSDKDIEERVECIDPDVVDRFYHQGRNVILVGGHYNNWELYALSAPLHLKHRAIALYHPLKDPFMDRKMRKMRERSGLELVPVHQARKAFEGKEEPFAVFFVADQSPPNAEKAHWMKFLNQDTGVMRGTEMFARRYGLPVIHGSIRKKERGHYTVEYEVICEDPSQWEQGAITEAFTKKLEQDILENPAYWLWSHRRWKKKKPAQAAS